MNDVYKINLRQKRSLSELISITFDFIKVNFKIILLSFLTFGVPLVVPGIYFFSKFTINMSTSMLGGGMDFDFPSLGIGLVLLFAGVLLYYISINVLVALYLDAEDPKSITINNIWDGIIKNLGKYIGAGVLITLMVLVGYVLLVIPAIYIGIAVSYVFFIITFEDKGVGNAISRSFEIIKGNWWSTFGFILLIGLIQGAIGYIVSLPLSLLNEFLIGPLSDGNSLDSATINTAIISSVISMTFTMFVSCISTVGIAIKYFSIVEDKERIGLQDEIEAMGSIEEEEE